MSNIWFYKIVLLMFLIFTNNGYAFDLNNLKKLGEDTLRTVNDSVKNVTEYVDNALEEDNQNETNNSKKEVVISEENKQKNTNESNKKVVISEKNISTNKKERKNKIENEELNINASKSTNVVNIKQQNKKTKTDGALSTNSISDNNDQSKGSDLLKNEKWGVIYTDRLNKIQNTKIGNAGRAFDIIPFKLLNWGDSVGNVSKILKKYDLNIYSIKDLGDQWGIHNLKNTNYYNTFSSSALAAILKGLDLQNVLYKDGYEIYVVAGNSLHSEKNLNNLVDFNAFGEFLQIENKIYRDSDYAEHLDIKIYENLFNPKYVLTVGFLIFHKDQLFLISQPIEDNIVLNMYAKGYEIDKERMKLCKGFGSNDDSYKDGNSVATQLWYEVRRNDIKYNQLKNIYGQPENMTELKKYISMKYGSYNSFKRDIEKIYKSSLTFLERSDCEKYLELVNEEALTDQILFEELKSSKKQIYFADKNEKAIIANFNSAPFFEPRGPSRGFDFLIKYNLESAKEAISIKASTDDLDDTLTSWGDIGVEEYEVQSFLDKGIGFNDAKKWYVLFERTQTKIFDLEDAIISIRRAEMDYSQVQKILATCEEKKDIIRSSSSMISRKSNPTSAKDIVNYCNIKTGNLMRSVELGKFANEYGLSSEDIISLIEVGVRPTYIQNLVKYCKTKFSIEQLNNALKNNIEFKEICRWSKSFTYNEMVKYWEKGIPLSEAKKQKRLEKN